MSHSSFGWSFGDSPSGAWQKFDCPGSTRRWRQVPDGKIEVEGLGAPHGGWTEEMNQWRPLILEKASKYEISPAWIAAIMRLESGGRPDVCYRPVKGGPCSTKDGAGLMAMLKSTASSLAGRTVELQELMDDQDLSVDLGAKLIRQLSDRANGDYLRMAVAYNAGYGSCKDGEVRCGSTTSSGRTVQSPKESCPPTPWGTIMGCVRTTAKLSHCVPSAVVPGMNVCPNLYPDIAIKAHNEAIEQGYYGQKIGPLPPEPNGKKEPPLIVDGRVGVADVSAARWVALGLGVAAGFLAVTAFTRPARP